MRHLTDDEASFVASRLHTRARQRTKSLGNAMRKTCHPELVKQLQADIAECSRLALKLQSEAQPSNQPCSHCGLSSDVPQCEVKCLKAEREIERLRTEEEFSYELTRRQADLLTGVVNALKGPPPELTLWSHYDAPMLAQACVREVERLRAALNEMEARAIAAAWLIPADTICGDLQALRDKAKLLLAVETEPPASAEGCTTCGGSGFIGCECPACTPEKVDACPPAEKPKGDWSKST
jgi:hypothetical protein